MLPSRWVTTVSCPRSFAPGFGSMGAGSCATNCWSVKQAAVSTRRLTLPICGTSTLPEQLGRSRAHIVRSLCPIMQAAGVDGGSSRLVQRKDCFVKRLGLLRANEQPQTVQNPRDPQVVMVVGAQRPARF